jgi:hypothetical protein
MLAAGAVVVLTAGCGSYTETSPASGVDELVIPTPSPDPDDFVATIDNPWLPLAPGSTWTYLSEDTSGTRLATTVEDGPTVAGVDTTTVRSVTTTLDARPVTTVDYYAQDTDGNVWWFGREGEWAAGDDDAEAGIAMLARPRVGDGYAEMGTPDGPGQRSVIRGVDEEVELAAQSYAHVLLIETTSPATGDEVSNHYVRGTGLVLRDLGPGMERGLVDHDEPQP